MNIGQRIKAARINKGLTQEALANGRISRSLISQIESGRCEPSARTITMIAEALELPVESLLGGQRVQDDHRLVNRLLTLSRFSQALPEARRADILAEALHVARMLGDAPLLARVLEAVGDLHYDQQRQSDALADYEQAIAVLEGEHRRSKSGIARLELKLGHCRYDLSQFADALPHYQRAANFGARDSELMVKATRNLGNTCVRLGRFSDSAEYFRESLRLAESRSDTTATAHAHLGLGSAIRKFGDATVALETARAAETLYQADSNALGVANARHNMGVAALDLGKLDEAKGWLNEALVFYNDRHLSAPAAAVHEELARYWVQAQDLDAAEAECRLGLALVEGDAPCVMSLRLEVMLATIERRLGKSAGDKRLRRAAQGLVDIGQGYELLALLDYLLQEAQRQREVRTL